MQKAKSKSSHTVKNTRHKIKALASVVKRCQKMHCPEKLKFGATNIFRHPLSTPNPASVIGKLIREFIMKGINSPITLAVDPHYLYINILVLLLPD